MCGGVFASFPSERGNAMVTYENLFLLGTLIVAIIALCFDINKKN